MSRRLLLACMAIGVAALSAPLFMQRSAHSQILLVYNPTDSVPRGWYRVRSIDNGTPLRTGTIVLARLPADVAAFASQRGYLPRNVPILKQVGAIAPQDVCVRQHSVRVDGAVVALALTHDGARRPLQAWIGCRHLAEGELFLLSRTNSVSFDSRYFGPVAAASILGIAQPLWTWSAP